MKCEFAKDSVCIVGKGGNVLAVSLSNKMEAYAARVVWHLGRSKGRGQAIFKLKLKKTKKNCFFIFYFIDFQKQKQKCKKVRNYTFCCNTNIKKKKSNKKNIIFAFAVCFFGLCFFVFFFF